MGDLYIDQFVVDTLSKYDNKLATKLDFLKTKTDRQKNIFTYAVNHLTQIHTRANKSFCVTVCTCVIMVTLLVFSHNFPQYIKK